MCIRYIQDKLFWFEKNQSHFFSSHFYPSIKKVCNILILFYEEKIESKEAYFHRGQQYCRKISNLFDLKYLFIQIYPFGGKRNTEKNSTEIILTPKFITPNTKGINAEHRKL